MLLQQIINGLALGSIYALIALGFSIIYKSTDILNLAHGDIMMISAFVAFVIFTKFNFPIIISYAYVLIFAILLGFVLDRLIFRPLIGYHLFPIVMATLSVGIIIKGLTGMIWGYTDRTLPSPFSESPIEIFSAVITSSHLGIIIISIILMIIFAILYKYTIIGTAMRANAQDPIASHLCGIWVKRIHSLSWVSGAVLAATAGILVAPIIFLSPSLSHVGLKALPAAVIGGFGSILGAVVGGFVLGLSEILAGAIMPETLKDSFPWIVVFIALLIRPEGLFNVYEKRKRV
ncbi:MAG: branched-chain amino acid ABC transporter permease [Desulfobacterales bacterium]|nr:branched-chain amino acid ABC transporter permease [Desulfobacterales bacterium]